jgi:hypothetical protein
MDSQAVGGGHMQVWYMVSRNMTVWSPRRSAGSVPLPPDGEYIGAKNASFEPFCAKNDHFAKTGSGQTQEKLKKEIRFSQVRQSTRTSWMCSRPLGILMSSAPTRQRSVWFQFITGVPGHVPCYRAGVAVPVTITHG